jgi:Fe-S cluster biogenesis protein NfuA
MIKELARDTSAGRRCHGCCDIIFADCPRDGIVYLHMQAPASGCRKLDRTLKAGIEKSCAILHP